MSVAYHCSHLAKPHPPLPPSYPSSSASLSPLSSLYFCEECDSLRCDQCVAFEVASYFCPNCLFDVPSANVRGDRNRCARSCFSCPQCTAALQVMPTDTVDPSTSQTVPGPPYLLACQSCRWSSRQIGWEFEKGTGLALQLQKMDRQPDKIQSEFDALKDHLDSYLVTSAPAATVPKSSTLSRQPTRHISHLTQMAAKALQRDVPGLGRPTVRKSEGGLKEPSLVSWDTLGEYKAKGTWKEAELENGLTNVERLSTLEDLNTARVERYWAHSWETNTQARSTFPQRIPLQTKLTKRCPDGACRHLLIQPDTKSTRFKIKMVASNYVPLVQVGRRRRRLHSGDLDQRVTAAEIEQRRRERRKTRQKGEDEDEALSLGLCPGEIYTFQLAFTNPLYDLIQIKLAQPAAPRNTPPPNHHLHIPTQHFTIAALKDAWAYDEDEEDDDSVPGLEGSEGTSEEAGGKGTLSRRSRKSLLAGPSTRDKRRGEVGVEKKGNVSKVAIEVEVLPGATGRVEFDLEVRYTYRSDEGTGKDQGAGTGKEEYKTFTYWVRVCIGEVEAGR